MSLFLDYFTYTGFAAYSLSVAWINSIARHGNPVLSFTLLTRTTSSGCLIIHEARGSQSLSHSHSNPRLSLRERIDCWKKKISLFRIIWFPNFVSFHSRYRRHFLFIKIACVMFYVSLHNENNPWRKIQPAATTSEYMMSRRMCNDFIEAYQTFFSLWHVITIQL